MSQSGILKVADNILPDDVATSYVTNSGTAIPIGKVIDIVGSGIASTSGVGNTITISVPDLTAKDYRLSFLFGGM